MEQLAALMKELRSVCPTLELRRDEPMRFHTTFRIGGPAALMALPKSEEEATCAVRCAYAAGIRPFLLGNGSNLLVSDDGYDGFVIKTAEGLEGMELRGECIVAQSGVTLARLANFALANSLTGLEFAHGIPGSLGGAVTMNAGAYDGEMKQVLRSVTFLDTQGEKRTLPAEELDLSYRHSAFSDGTRLILSAELSLRPGDPEEIRAKMEDLMARRKSKQPLEYPSAGSTFKRPTGYYAGPLIEQCGLKGARVGGAQVSEKHAGFVINRENATCAEVLALTTTSVVQYFMPEPAV